MWRSSASWWRWNLLQWDSWWPSIRAYGCWWCLAGLSASTLTFSRLRWEKNGARSCKSSPNSLWFFTGRRFCGSGTVFSTRAQRCSSVLRWLSSCTTSRRSSEPALCPTCASVSDRSPLELFLSTVTPSCRWGHFYIHQELSRVNPHQKTSLSSYHYEICKSRILRICSILFFSSLLTFCFRSFNRKYSPSPAACPWQLFISWEWNAENKSRRTNLGSWTKEALLLNEHYWMLNWYHQLISIYFSHLFPTKVT